MGLARATGLWPRSLPASLLGTWVQKPRIVRRLGGRQQPRCQAPPPGGAAAGAASGPGDEAWRPAAAENAPLLPPSSVGWQDEAVEGSTSASKDGSHSPGYEGGAGSRWAQPGPLAAVAEAGRAYDRAVKANPVLTKALTSFAGFALGDRIAQSVTGEPYDVFRCLRLALYGLLLDGPVGHAWYQLLDRHVCPEDPTSTRAVLIKTALDQLVWGPLMTLVFFAFLKTLEGHPELILPTITQRFWPTMVANYALWPLAHLVNFKFVPTDYRILFNNVVALFWTTYLSFTCGPPSAVGSRSGAGEAAAAASALLSALPCHKVEGAMALPGVAQGVRQVAALEQMLSHWGAQSLPSGDLLVSYLNIKAELMKSVCQHPIRMPPS